MSEAAGVPARIIVLGTSTQTLNERFSKIPPPMKFSRVNQQQPLNGNEDWNVENDFLIGDDGEALEGNGVAYTGGSPRFHDSRNFYRPSRGIRKPFHAYSGAVPITSRLSFMPVARQFVPSAASFTTFRNASFDFVPRGQFGGNRFSQTYTYNRGFGFRGRRGGSRGARGGSFARGRGGRRQQQPQKSKEELDRELEEYMRRSKHPKISADGI